MLKRIALILAPYAITAGIATVLSLATQLEKSTNVAVAGIALLVVSLVSHYQSTLPATTALGAKKADPS